jgi:hypothetical protein
VPARSAPAPGLFPAPDGSGERGQGPSPPDALHDRGSQGLSGVTAGVGDENVGGRLAEPELEPDPDPVPEGAVVAGADDAVEDEPEALPVDEVGGGLTLNCEPVTTVTWAPSATSLGL